MKVINTQSLIADAHATQRQRIVSKDVVDKVFGAGDTRLAEKLADCPSESASLWIN